MRASCLALLVAIGCGGPTEAPPPVERPPRAVRERPIRPVRETLYGSDGQLVETDERVAGFPLPRGMTKLRDEGRRHIYRTEAPLGKVQAYFGRRLMTGQVDRQGEAVVYRDALARNGSPVHLDVTIAPGSTGLTRVEIHELAPPAVNPPTEADYERQLARDMQRWD